VKNDNQPRGNERTSILSESAQQLARLGRDRALIDYFHDMSLLRNGEDNSINFQKASCTLDGCVNREVLMAVKR
jgi:hypothetical protein